MACWGLEGPQCYMLASLGHEEQEQETEMKLRRLEEKSSFKPALGTPKDYRIIGQVLGTPESQFSRLGKSVLWHFWSLISFPV